MDSQLEDIIIGLVADTIQVPRDKVGLHTTAESLVEWDSLNHLYIILAIEQYFGIALLPEEVVRMTEICVIVEVVEEHVRR